MDIKIVLAILSLVVSFGTFLPYFVGISRHQTVPHVFSWTTWGILDGLGFILSAAEGGGAGALIFASESVLSFSIAGYAYFRGEKEITLLDKFSFGSAIVIIAVYGFTRDALVSVCLASIIYTLGFVPTFRKSYLKPHNEPALTYFLTAVGFAFSLGALETYTFVSVLFPVVVLIESAMLTAFLLLRRKLSTLPTNSGG